MGDLNLNEIQEHGQIKKMLLPSGWLEGEVKEGPFAVQSLRWFHPPDDIEARLSFYYRGHPVGEAAGASFHKLLEEAPQELSEDQLWKVQEVLRDAAPVGDFAIRSAHTGVVKGKRVLVVDGSHSDRGWDRLAVFVDVDGSGCIVQEIYFTAPQERFNDYVSTVMQCLRTVEWQEPREIDPAQRDAELGLKDIGDLEPLELGDLPLLKPAPPPPPRPETADGIDLTGLFGAPAEP
jgi:hypothetical protein